MSKGILLINKPAEMTSFEVIKVIKKKLSNKKVGHCGTLDSFATGLLIVALGKATKALTYLQKQPKEYLTTFQLGKVSTTHEINGHIQTISSAKVDLKTIKKILPKFIGPIKQRPPGYSAIKIKGQRASDRLRKGEKIEIAPRDTMVFNLEIIDFYFPFLTLKINCSSGFYVRSLCRDLGKQLKIGAMCTALQRNKIGSFSLQNSYSLQELTEDKILKLSADFFDFKNKEIDLKDLEKIKMGQKIYWPLKQDKNKTVSLSYQNEIIAFGNIKESFFYPHRVLLDF